MKKFSTILTVTTARLAALAILLLVAAGCGERVAKLTSEESKTFDSAPADVKETWEKALAADKANDYVTAAAALDSLKKMTLSDAQNQALDTERNAFGERLMKAVEKNDPKAIQALQNSKNAGNTRTR